MTAGLELRSLQVRRGNHLLVDLSATIAPGEVLTIMGPSGSGKSTLLAAIVGSLDRSFDLSGAVLLAGRDVTRLPIRDRQIGLLFQDAVLFPHLSVAGNLAFALPGAIRPTAARMARVTEALAQAGLAGMGSHDPATLSGGQKARVALMRTLLASPRALLLDEPFSGLDAALRLQIRRFVFDTAAVQNLPVILVTHDPDDARAAAGRVMTPLGVPVSV